MAGVVMIYKDITPHKMADEAFNFAGIGILQYNIDGIIKQFDDGCLRIFDLQNRYPDPIEVIGKSIYDLTVYSESFRAAQKKILKDDKVRHLVYRFTTLTGNRRWILHNSRFAADPRTGEKTIQAIIRDITVRKEAEYNLEEKSLFLDSILDSLKEIAIVATDSIFRIKYFNPAAERLFNYEANEVIGESLIELFVRKKDDLSCFDRAVESARYDTEFGFTVKRIIDGTPYHIEHNIRGIKGSGNQLTGYIMIANIPDSTDMAQDGITESYDELTKNGVLKLVRKAETERDNSTEVINRTESILTRQDK
jgi:PAS domain S-box-containing protein